MKLTELYDELLGRKKKKKKEEEEDDNPNRDLSVQTAAQRMAENKRRKREAAEEAGRY
jgi:hypothetical protein